MESEQNDPDSGARSARYDRRDPRYSPGNSLVSSNYTTSDDDSQRELDPGDIRAVWDT